MVSQNRFSEFAEALRDLWWADCRFKAKLIEATEDPEIAWAVFGRCENQSLHWLNSPANALSGGRPAALLATEEGRERLRMLLLEMHD